MNKNFSFIDFNNGSSKPSDVKAQYESNPDTNALTDALKASIELNKVKSVSSDTSNNTITFTYTDDTTDVIDLTTLVPDIHVSGATLDATTNVLTLTSDDGGADVTVDLSDFVNSSELATALSNKADNVFLTKYVRAWSNGTEGNIVNRYVEIQAITLDNIIVSGTAYKIGTDGVKQSSYAQLTDGYILSSNYVVTPNGRSGILLELDTPTELKEVKLWRYFSDSSVFKETSIEVSNDGITWYTIQNYQTNGTYTETADGYTAEVIVNATTQQWIHSKVTKGVFDNNQVLRGDGSDKAQGSGVIIDDDNNMSTIGDISSNDGKHKLSNKADNSFLTKYVRAWSNGSSANAGNHYVEIQAIKLDGSIASGTGYKMGTDGVKQESEAILTDGDFDYANYVGTDTGRSGILLELDSITAITEVKLWRYYNDGRIYFETAIEISEDGVNWYAIQNYLTDGTYAETADGYTSKVITDRIVQIKLSNKVDKVQSTDRAITIFNGTDGDIQDSQTSIADDGSITATSFIGDGSQLTNLPIPSGQVDSSGSGSFAQYGFIPDEEINELKPKDMFEEVDEANVLRFSEKASMFPIRFTDGVYGRTVGARTNVHDIFNDGSAVATYMFDDNVLDLGGNYNGTEIGTITYVDGKFGKSIRMVDDSSGVSVTPDTYKSVSLWVYKENSDAGNNYILDSRVNGDSYCIWTSSNKFYCNADLVKFTVDGVDTALDGDTPSREEWHHIYIEFKYTQTTKTTLGIFHDGGDYEFGGRIDQARFFNRALTQEEIQSLYNSSSDVSNQIQQFLLPKAPFATGSTDELLDDAVNGITTQIAHSKGDIVVCGNELNSISTLYSSARATSHTYSDGVDSFQLVDDSSTADGYVSIDLNLIVGEKYHLRILADTVSTSSSAGSYENFIQDSSGEIAKLSNFGTTEMQTVTFTATEGARLTVYANDTTINYSNFSVKLKDQSYIATKDTADMYELDTNTSYTIDSNTSFIVKCTGANTSGVVGHYYQRIDGFSATSLNLQTGTSLNNTSAYEDLGTSLSSGVLLSNPYFKAIPYVTKQVALLIEKTNTGAILNTVKPLVNMYGEENVLTYEADVFGELGYSQKDGRVWTDGSSEFILIGLKGYLNGGAYHPWFSPFGATGWKDSRDNRHWYEDRLNRQSTYRCFYPANGSTEYGSNVNQGFIGAPNTVLRPDSKLYDKCYIEGQGGLICYSIPNAKTPTYKHQEEVKRNLLDGYIEDGVEYTQFYQHPVITGDSYQWDSNLNRYYITASGYVDTRYAYLGSTYINNLGRVFVVTGDNGKVGVFKTINNNGYGDEVMHFPHSNGNLYIGECIYSTDGVIGKNKPADMLTLFPKGTTLTLHLTNKSPYLVTQGSHLYTDLIGDPANYNRTNATYVSPTDTSITDMADGTLVWDNATGKMYKANAGDGSNDLDANGLPVPAFTDAKWSQVTKGYPQSLLNVLNSKKGVGFVNALLTDDSGNIIPDGSLGLRNIKLSKKLKQRYTRIYDGASSNPSNGNWDTSSGAYNYVSNENTGTGIIIGLIPYITQNQSAISITTPQPIEVVNRDLIASNHHSVHAYNGLTYASSNKIATGSSVESKGVDNVLCDVADGILSSGVKQTFVLGRTYIADGSILDSTKGMIYKRRTNSYTGTPTINWNVNSEPQYFEKVGISNQPAHNTLTLDAQSIVGSKALITQTSKGTQVFTQEMIWDSTNATWNDSSKFDNLADGVISNTNGDTIQTKILYKASSVKI